MSRHTPDVDDLIGGQAVGRERDRLARVHAALVRSGPLPELPPSLERLCAGSVRGRPFVRPERRWRRPAVAAAAATVALAAASAGYFISTPVGDTFARTVAMHATAAAPLARATLRIGVRDQAGNWPITLSVHGLPPLPAGSYYEVLLTDRERIVGACGRFRTDGGATVVHLNDPYAVGEYSGWLIRRQQVDRRPGPAALTT